VSPRALAALRLLRRTRRPEGLVLDRGTRREVEKFLAAFIVFSLERRPAMLQYVAPPGRAKPPAGPDERWPRESKMKRINAFLFLVAAAAALAGCGYSLGPLFRPDLRTVAVDLSDNLDRRARGFERDVHLALVDELTLQGLKIVDRKDADSILQGEILDSWKTPLSETRFNQVRESEVEFRMAVTWTDRRTGEALLPRTFVRGVRSIVDAQQETLTSIQPSLARRLARQIVQRLEELPARNRPAPKAS